MTKVMRARRLEELKKRNPTPEQQEAYEKIVQLATNTIPLGAPLMETPNRHTHIPTRIRHGH